MRAVVLVVFAGLLGLTCWLFYTVPGGFIPAQDKQYLIGIVQLPDAASLDRTEEIVRQVSKIGQETPGVTHSLGFSGLSVQGFVNLSNAAVVFFPLDDFDKRTTKSLSGDAIAATLNQRDDRVFAGFALGMLAQLVAHVSLVHFHDLASAAHRGKCGTAG